MLKESFNLTPDEIIPFGLDSESFPDKFFSEKTIDIISVGNLAPVKNFTLFIEIINDLKGSFPNLKVFIAGGGQEYQKLKAIIKEYDLTDTVVLSGALPRNEVILKIRTSKVLLHTSMYEGQGYVFLEALANGAYVVSFPVGYLPAVPQVCSCATKDQMTSLLRKILSSAFIPQPIPVITISDSVKKFHILYSKFY